MNIWTPIELLVTGFSPHHEGQVALLWSSTLLFRMSELAQMPGKKGHQKLIWPWCAQLLTRFRKAGKRLCFAPR